MWIFTSWRTEGLLGLLDRIPARRGDLDEFFDEQGWTVIHDRPQPTGPLAVDAGWGIENGRGLLLYLDGGELVMLTAVLGPFKNDARRGELVPAMMTASQRYGSIEPADGGGMWETGTGQLLIAPEGRMVTAVWVKHGYLADATPLRKAGLSLRVLEKMVADGATGPGWPDAVTRAAELVPDEVEHRDRWELIAAVATAVNMFAMEQDISPLHVRDTDVAESLAAALAATSRPPDPDVESHRFPGDAL